MQIGMILSTPLPAMEGIGFYTWNLARFLTHRGYKIHLITRGGYRSITPQEVDGITIWRPIFFPIYPFHVHLHNLFVNSLIHHLESEIDIYHLHTPLVAIPSTQKPILVTVHTPLKADSRSIQVDNWLSLLVKLQMPVSLHVEKQLLKKANRLVAVAQSVAGELNEYGFNPQDIPVLGNGVDTDIFFPSINNSESTPLYFLSAGRLGLRKGFEDLILCAQIVTRHHSNVQFWIAGDGPLRDKLEGLIKQLELTAHVRLLGHISSHKAMANLYQQAAGFIHPAHYEGLPTVLLEAMACGCPVVATAVSGALDVVQDGMNGLLVAPRNPQGLAEAVERLLIEPSLGKSLGKAARQAVEEHFSWDMITSRYIQQYECLVQGN